jgi:Txe/YoeB family toxin of toxin-antitoxin system
VTWQLYYTKQALKDAKKLASSNLRPQAERLLEILKKDPFQSPPAYEKLVGDLDGAWSRRINIQHRLVYQIYPEKKAVKIIRMWTHYE